MRRVITLAQLIPIVSTTGSFKNSSDWLSLQFSFLRIVNIFTAIKVTRCTSQCASLHSFALDYIYKYFKPVFIKHKKNEACLFVPKL